MPSSKRISFLSVALLLCAGCIGHGQGQINWKQQRIAPPADSFGVQTNAYILGVSNNVVWRMFPVSLLASNVLSSSDGSLLSNVTAVAVSNGGNLTNVNIYALGINEPLEIFNSAGIEVASISASGCFTGCGTGLNGIPISALLATGTLSSNVFLRGDEKWTGIWFATNSATATNALRVTPTESYTNRTVDMTAQTNVYDDIVFPLTTLNPPGLESPATLIATNGPSGDQMALYTDVNNVLFVVAQMPHTWTAGTTIYPHIHHTPASANSVTSVWRVAYSVADIGGTLPTSTVVTQQVITAAGQWAHRLNDVPTNGISMSGKTGPSTIVSMKYTLLSTSEPLRIKSYDVHYRWGGSPVIFNPSTYTP